MKVVIDIPNDFTGDYIVDKFKDFFSRVIADIDCKGICGRYEKEIAEMFLKAFDDSEEKISCNCKHNSNSRDNEPCRCDSIESKVNKAKVDSLEIITRMLDDKPYYELKYRQVGKKDYSIGYSSYDLKTVLSDINTYFEIVENNDKHTNADRIRNMSDEELAEFNLCPHMVNWKKGNYDICVHPNDKDACKKCMLEWLQSEAE